MKTVMIMGIPNDYHSMAVQWGIEQLGGSAYVWMPGDLPDFSSASIEFSGNETNLEVRHDGKIFSLNDVGVLWNRRLSAPIAPNSASPHDVATIERESFEHVRNIRLLMARRTRAINHPAKQFEADRKALQIQIAIDVGLKVPPTLFSNDYAAILAFHKKNAPVIAKPYQPCAWITEEGTVAQLTCDMPPPTDFDPAALEACPLIIQRRIDRAFEVRLIVMDGTITAVKMVERSRDGILDSRKAIRANAMSFSLVDPPEEVKVGCHKYMSETGLEFGAFDFIVDNLGNWFFLECNEQGQFLFLEQVVPESRLLDKFCRWLMLICGADEANLSMKDELVLKDFENSDRVRELRGLQSKHKPRKQPAQLVREIEFEDAVGS